MQSEKILNLYSDFLGQYDADSLDKQWGILSDKFRTFWKEKVLTVPERELSEEQVDEIIKILDRNAKGNKKGCLAIARVMIPQGAWRRMFNEIHTDLKLATVLNQVLLENDPSIKAELIDNLYKMNVGKKNNLTGPSGNAICTFLAAYDPFKNSSIISLNDRMKLIHAFDMTLGFDYEAASIGKRIVATNEIITKSLSSLGIVGSSRTVSRFCYFGPMKQIWRSEHTVKGVSKDLTVVIPTDSESESVGTDTQSEVRESIKMQALLANIGSQMGYTIWVPKSDRSRVLKEWAPDDGVLLEHLPLNYNDTTLKTIEQIDILWLKNRSIVRAFEVEHTTSVYSGLLRMADLLALQPNMKIMLHIVAPSSKREKVLQEIRRPVFSLLESGPLAETCTYISYDNLRDLAQQKHLGHLSAEVLDDYAEGVESDEAE